MFISSDNQTMVVILEFNRVFLYKNETVGSLIDVKWNLIRMIDDFPFDI